MLYRATVSQKVEQWLLSIRFAVEIPHMSMQISELEQAADELIALESRAEMAEADAEAAEEAMTGMTPRPSRPSPAAEQLLGSEGLQALQAAALQYRCADAFQHYRPLHLLVWPRRQASAAEA